MSLIFVALSFYAIADFNFVNQVMDGQYSLSSLSTGSILVVSALICWAAFEQRHSEDRRSVEGPSIEVEGLAKQWEGLLPPLAVAGVLVVALIQRHRLDTSLIPYVVGASLAFIGSLAMRNWWGSGLETRLRVDATQSQSALEGTNDELAAQNIELRRTQFELVESQGRLAVHQERLEYLVDERTRELEESRRALHTADRLASLGTLAAGLAHELNNPLGIIRLQAEDALLLSAKSKSDDALRGILEQTHRCAAIVKGVLRFSRDEPSQKRAEDLVDIVMDSIKLTDHYAAESGVEVIRRIGEGLGDDRDPGSSTVMGSATELEQVIVILLRNAVEASDFGSRVYVNVSRLEGLLRVEVVDEGKGMTGETREHAFDPFYTTKRDEGGTGLGLSIAHGIADQHGGSLRIHSQEGKGTTITLELARLEEA